MRAGINGCNSVNSQKQITVRDFRNPARMLLQMKQKLTFAFVEQDPTRDKLEINEKDLAEFLWRLESLARRLSISSPHPSNE